MSKTITPLISLLASTFVATVAVDVKFHKDNIKATFVAAIVATVAKEIFHHFLIKGGILKLSMPLTIITDVLIQFCSYYFVLHSNDENHGTILAKFGTTFVIKDYFLPALLFAK